MMAEHLGHGGARFLLAVIDGGGTVPPAIGLAAELVRRGHEVHVLADPTIEASARSAGCAFSPWRDAPHVNSRSEQTALIAALEGRNPLRAFRAAKDFAAGKEMTRRFAGDVVATIREFPVDAVLADGLPGILIGAQSTGLPTAALLAQTYLRPTPGLPLMGTGWSPGPGVLRRTRDTLVPRTVSWLLGRTLPRLNAVVASYGQLPLHDVFELFDRCTKVLVMTSPSFDFVAPRLPVNVRYVGPQLDDPAWATAEWHSQGTDPLVLVATSSIFQHQVGLLRRIARALGQLPVRGLMTTGPAVDPDEIEAPPNVDVVQAAPHSRILPEASVVITHAGHGTMIKALAAGVPLVCIPMGRDQKDNTVRALRHGAGIRLSAKSTPDKIAAAVANLLDDPHYAAAARHFAHILAQEATTTPSAADEAEAMVRS
ncbi:nucleotide disphospho-sugar-binding domain-containing protein [Diaminobutyricimonas sp. TR449]|uniref:glycosyltransferase n=2 Tax=unclassified Diaminobutyricimonas TaxID=2643261 RepID=UPI0012F47BEF|nr:nucleotide disphospho-sugar-binding domain-containing protein [Diaminobutyricimonas sp. TR449]